MRVRQITSADPAAGAQIIVTVPAGVLWKLKSFVATLVTSATVANRTPLVVIKDQAGTVQVTATSDMLQAPSTTFEYTWAIGLVLGYQLSSKIMSPLADMWLGRDFTIETGVVNMQAGDNWSVAELIVEERVGKVIAFP